MNQTIKLLQTIGSPFAASTYSPQNGEETLELYMYAIKNKIGLHYLKALKRQGKLWGFETEYADQSRKYSEIMVTAARAAKFLNSRDTEYAVFKSIMPFPGTPNDIDIIFLCSDSEYREAAEKMLRAGYSHVWDEAPLQVTRHDLRNGPHLDPINKDVYDLDLYEEIGASHVIYLDKRKLKNYTTSVELSGEKVKVLMPEADLAAMVVHSIIPEQLFTLLAYYATLYYLAHESFDRDKFIYIAKENNITFPVRIHCSLVAELHKVAHGFIPEELEIISNKLKSENETREGSYLREANFKMPYLYSKQTLIKALLEKTKDKKFRRSVMRQGLSMLNPIVAKKVISEVSKRRSRETY